MTLGPLLYIHIYLKIPNNLFEDTHQRKTILLPQLLPLVYYYTLTAQIIPLFTLTLVRTWYEESTPHDLRSPYIQKRGFEL